MARSAVRAPHQMYSSSDVSHLLSPHSPHLFIYTGCACDSPSPIISWGLSTWTTHFPQSNEFIIIEACHSAIRKFLLSESDRTAEAFSVKYPAETWLKLESSSGLPNKFGLSKKPSFCRRPFYHSQSSLNLCLCDPLQSRSEGRDLFLLKLSSNEYGESLPLDM